MEQSSGVSKCSTENFNEGRDTCDMTKKDLQTLNAVEMYFLRKKCRISGFSPRTERRDNGKTRYDSGWNWKIGSLCVMDVYKEWDQKDRHNELVSTKKQEAW